MENVRTVHLLDHMTGSLALAEAGNGIFFAFALERIVHSGLEGLSVDRELQFYHALFELFTGNQIHLKILQT